jgi:hypothetical protein
MTPVERTRADDPCEFCDHGIAFGSVESDHENGARCCAECAVTHKLTWKLHVEHKGGVPWDQTPAPRRFHHRHSAHTTQWTINGTSWGGDPNAIVTCRCGARQPLWNMGLDLWVGGDRFGGYFREQS